MLLHFPALCISISRRSEDVGGNDDRGTANRAADVGAEPGVDAGRVERVRAAREEADELAVVELAEAHRAVPAGPQAAVLHGGYGRDGGLVEPHRADVPDVVHHPTSAAARLPIPVVVEPFAVRQRGGGRAPPPAAQGAAAAVEEEHGEREREEEEGGEEGDGEEEAYGQALVDGDRGARERRQRRRRRGVVGAVAAGAAREALERVVRAVERDGDAVAVAAARARQRPVHG